MPRYLIERTTSQTVQIEVEAADRDAAWEAVKNIPNKKWLGVMGMVDCKIINLDNPDDDED